MGRWTDLAQWRGPTPNCGDGDRYAGEPGDRMRSHRGMVVHIAEGFYDGTIAWQANPKSRVSSHFVVGRDGRCAQMVDTDIRSWCQRAGNADWLSIECEGFTAGHRLHRTGWERLSAPQIERAARLLVRAHEVYGVPLQVADSPGGRGLGHHSMGVDWGHQACPGAPIIAQRRAIVDLARVLAQPTLPDPDPGPADWTGDIMRSLPTLRRGSTGAPVRRLQALLNAAGQRLAEDGEYGPLTERAVRAEQSQSRIAVDGIVGRYTWSALLGVLR